MCNRPKLEVVICAGPESGNGAMCLLTGEHPAELWQAVPDSLGPLHGGGPLDCGLSQRGADQPASRPCHPAPDPVVMPA